MAITAIDNQAVKLVTPGNTFQDKTALCDCVGLDFCQWVERADDTCFQVDLTEATGIELVTEPGFNSGVCGLNWTCGANWSIFGSRAHKTAGGANSISQDIGMEDDKYYKITYTIFNLSGGNATVGVGIGPTLVLSTHSTNGTFTIYHFASAGQSEIVFGGDNAAIYDLDTVSVKEMSSVGIRIRNTDGTLEYSETDGTSVTYVDTKAMICIDWTNVTDDGCERIELMDLALETSNLVADGTFDGGCGVQWNCNGGVAGAWNIAAGVATASTGAPFGYPAAQRELEQDVLLLGGKCFTLTFDISNYVGGSGSVQTDSGVGTPATFIGNWAGAGSFSFSIDLRGQPRQTRLRFIASFLTSDYDLDNVVITVADACKEIVYESECFFLKDTHSCSTLFTWTNDDNAYGLNYEDFVFVQSFRHNAKLWKPNYSKEKTTHRDSAGDRTILYSSTTKEQRLSLQLMPEYLHDAFSIGIEHDTFTIDAVEYVNVETDYEPQWNSSLLAGVDIEIIKDDQNLVNSNC